jgi:1-acyl-sn-glycerol-3-phosphate acyltransferase
MHTNITKHKFGTNAPWLTRLANVLLPMIGWQAQGVELLTGPKYVLAVAPHTSNWDVPIGLIGAHAIGLFQGWKCGYLIKASAIRWPGLGRFLKHMGGIPIERTSAQDVVDQVVDVFRKADRLLIAITPEGTRSRRDYWKTGFYRIALKAEVPIGLVFLDYQRRLAGIGKVFEPSGDLAADFEIIRDFYRNVTAKYPNQFGEIRFKPNAPA